MKNSVYEKAMEFKRKYPSTIAWRIKKHCDVIQGHLNPGEEVKYVFVAQNGQSPFEVFNTYACVLTNKRLLFARKRLLWGYFFLSVTPDLFNDMRVKRRLIWGLLVIDTVKEVIKLSNISKHALIELETQISSYMMEEKKKYKIMK